LPKIRISAHRTPTTRLNRVNTLARTMAPTDRLDRRGALLT
jgi:hypothetical protein